MLAPCIAALPLPQRAQAICERHPSRLFVSRRGLRNVEQHFPTGLILAEQTLSGLFALLRPFARLNRHDAQCRQVACLMNVSLLSCICRELKKHKSDVDSKDAAQKYLEAPKDCHYRRKK